MTRQTSREIEAEASRWLMRIDRDGRTPLLAAELDAWLAEDSRRRGALLQAEAAWSLLDRLPEPERAEAPPVADDLYEQQVPRFSRRWLLLGGSVAIAASFAGGLFLLNRAETYTTAIGEIRRVPLADGSIAAINTKSGIAVALASEQRVVRLDQGEVWFQVAHDPARPFLVEAGRVRIMAIGTAFSVRRRARGTYVLVTEGVVETWVEGIEDHRVRVSAGEQAFVAENRAIERSPADASKVDRTLAWRSGRIDLAGESLAHAADEFNRYNRKQIVIADPRLAGEHFYGVFRTNDPEGFASAVRRSLDVPVETDATEIRIGRPAS